MSRPYTYEELRKIVAETPIEGSIVESILDLVDELTEEYYLAGHTDGFFGGYDQGREDALAGF